MDWDDFRYLNALAHAASVRGAAGNLGVNASTVTRRLDNLEQKLGVRLFTRTRSGLQITAEGAEVVEQLDQIAVDIDEIERRLRGRDAEPAGPVKIAMPDVFALSLLMGEFASFAVQNPLIHLEFIPADRHLDMQRREADVSLRITDRPPESLVGRCLGGYRMSAYASSAYMQTHSPLTHPEGAVWIESDLEIVRAPGFKGRHFPSVPIGVKCNNVLLQLSAVREHMGVTLLPCLLGDVEPDLVRVGDIAPVDGQQIWLLFHPELRGVARVARVTGFLQEAFERLQNRLQGE